MTVAPRSLGERLRWARERAFVGRSAQLDRFRHALAGAPGAFAVLYVHGPGGVGKSTLLRRFADEARDAGRSVVEVNCRLIDPSPAGFEAEAGPCGRDTVLLIDAFEHGQGLEGWLRDRFLPVLPDGVLVVVAGREPPSPVWTSDVAWSDALAVAALGDLDLADARALLRLRGAEPAVAEQILAFTGGHPLAVTLAASLASGADGSTGWAPTPDVLAALLSQLVGDIPGPAHRLALEVAAHAMTVTEGLLRAVLGEEQSGPMFTWLRRLPIADWGRQGLFLHELAGDTIDTDLRWRDPDGYERMHRRVGHHLLERSRTAPPAEAMVAIRELTYLKRYGPMGAYFRMRREGDYHEDVLRAGDHDAVHRLVAEAEGPESAAIADFWLTRQPEAFWIYRDSGTGEPVGFLTWLRLGEPDPAEAAADPLVARAWAHVGRDSPLRTGEHLRMARFMVDPADYGQVSPVLHLMQLRICADWIRSDGLAWSFIVSPLAELWGPLMDHLGHQPVTALEWPNGYTYTLFACDWRVTPLAVWFDRTQPGALSGSPAEPAADRPAALTRADFDAAVRAALRDWHRDDALAANPLCRSGMLPGRPDQPPGNESTLLREMVTAALDALRADPRQVKPHRVLTATFLHRVPSQAAAAERLGLPFSTYRRHLQRGQERLCELLWHRMSRDRATTGQQLVS